MTCCRWLRSNRFGPIARIDRCDPVVPCKCSDAFWRNIQQADSGPVDRLDSTQLLQQKHMEFGRRKPKLYCNVLESASKQKSRRNLGICGRV
jgi:hypothetical protein